MSEVIRQSVTYSAPYLFPMRQRERVALIIARIANSHGVTVDDITGPSRTQPITKPRHEVMYLARCLGWSTTQIGMRLGGRDHSTVIQGARKHAQRHGLPCPWERV